MKFRDFAHQRQAETGAGHAGVLYPRYAVELLEYALQIGLGNAVSLVRHLESDILFPGVRRDGDGGRVGAVLDGVRDQVLDGTRQQVGIGEEWRAKAAIEGVPPRRLLWDGKTMSSDKQEN